MPEQAAVIHHTLTGLIKALMPRERQLLSLHWLDGLTIPEIAIVLGVSEDDTQQELTLLRDKVFNELDGKGIDNGKHEASEAIHIYH